MVMETDSLRQLTEFNSVNDNDNGNEKIEKLKLKIETDNLTETEKISTT